jgi:very-short-patch-repair endonuclease
MSPREVDSRENRLSVPEDVRLQVTALARKLRTGSTRSERILWQILRNRRFFGRKFRRQQPIGPFIVDFFCAEERLVIEVDGGIHNNQVEHDSERQQLLEASGLRVLRVTSQEVENDLTFVLSKIRNELGSDRLP